MPTFQEGDEVNTGNNIADFIMDIGPVWDRRVHSADSIAVEEGSELDDAVRLPGGLPIAAVVWRLIADGGSHLYAHDKWMRSSDGGLLVKSSATLGRAAAICGSRALFILSGADRRERRVRALQIMNDDADGLKKIADARMKRRSPRAADDVEAANQYKADIAQALIGLGHKGGSAKSDTALFSEAVAYFPPAVQERAELQISNMWLLSSAMAHGRLFGWDIGVEDQGAVDQLVFAWGIPSQLLEMAWDKWNALRVGQSGDTPRAGWR